MSKVLIVGIGNPAPTFILRRLEALQYNGVELIIVAQYNLELNIRGASIVRVGNYKSLPQLLSAVFMVFSMPGKFFRMLQSRNDLRFGKRIAWAIKYLPVLKAPAPDVIHIQWIASMLEFEWLRKFYNCPIIASARGSQVTIYPHTRKGYLELIKNAIQITDYIHCVSNDIAKVCESLGAKKEQLIVNYNGIDLKKFTPDNQSKVNKEFTLISVGALMWRKGLGFQLQIVKKMHAAGNAVKLIWIGDGPDREALEYTATILGIRDLIHFVGKVSAAELPAHLHRADVYISTSIAEGLPNSVVEASACGLPVVSFQCEGISEIIKPGVSGFILPFGEIDGMVDKITYLKNDQVVREKMSKAARLQMEEKFDEEQWVLRMIKIYNSLERK